MVQFYLPPEKWKTEPSVQLDGDEARHVRDAFRLKLGDGLRLFNGIGDAAEGRITAASKSVLDIAIERRLPRESEPLLHVTLAQSLMPHGGMDEIIRQATELGVSRILPVASDRSIVKLDAEKRRSKMDHWRKTALAACKQCDRNTLPEVSEAVTGRELAAHFAGYDTVLVACPVRPEFELDCWVQTVPNPKKLLIAIGPEGDFSPDEMQLYRKHGAKVVSLGPTVMKSDTAAAYALSIINFISRRTLTKI